VHLSGAQLRGARLDRTDLARADFVGVSPDTTAEGPVAAPSGDDARYIDELRAYFADGGCDDEYAARGLSVQALSGTDGVKPRLARMLGNLAADESCRALQLLPSRLKDDLQRYVRRYCPDDAGRGIAAPHADGFTSPGTGRAREPSRVTSAPSGPCGGAQRGGA
jgi:hypothetical protein